MGELLSDHAVTLDGIAPLRADLAPFVVARVVESEKIPETKLSFNKVDDGSGTLLEVVCGAPNVAVGALYPFARTGTVLPAGLTIEKRKIRGFTSNGMLCSARELGLGDDHDGILALDVDVPPGTPLLSAMPIGDTQLELDVLPNRPDLLSHRGVAREIAALTGVAMELPAELAVRARPISRSRSPASTAATPRSGVRVTVEDPAGAPHYIAVVIRGVKVGGEPRVAQAARGVGRQPLDQQRGRRDELRAARPRPARARVRPREARAATRSSCARRRPARRSSRSTASTRKLEPWMTIIADGERATALAGVMGGKASEVTDATTDILLEVAHFESARRAQGPPRARISTDASYRFERGVDGGATAEIAALAARLHRVRRRRDDRVGARRRRGAPGPRGGSPAAERASNSCSARASPEEEIERLLASRRVHGRAGAGPRVLGDARRPGGTT